MKKKLEKPVVVLVEQSDGSLIYSATATKKLERKLKAAKKRKSL